MKRPSNGVSRTYKHGDKYSFRNSDKGLPPAFLAICEPSLAPVLTPPFAKPLTKRTSRIRCVARYGGLTRLAVPLEQRLNYDYGIASTICDGHIFEDIQSLVLQLRGMNSSGRTARTFKNLPRNALSQQSANREFQQLISPYSEVLS